GLPREGRHSARWGAAQEDQIPEATEKAIPVPKVIAGKHCRQHQEKREATTSSCFHRGSEIPSDIEHPEAPPEPPYPWPDKGGKRQGEHGKDKNRGYEMTNRSRQSMFLDDRDFPVAVLRVLPP